MYLKRINILLEVKLNISPAKRRKKSEKIVDCILRCTKKGTESVIKFSETSRKTVYEAAKKRNHENVIGIIYFFEEGLPPPEYDYL